MDTSATIALAERVARLESENRRIRRVGAAALLVLAACGLYLASASQHRRDVQAERFVVTDANGAPRGTFGVSRSGLAELILRDENGEEQFAVRADANGASDLQILRKGRLLAQLGGSVLGPTLQLLDHEGFIAATLYSRSNGATGLALHRARARGGVELGVERDGSTCLRFTEPDGTLCGGWSFSPDGQVLAHHAGGAPNPRFLSDASLFADIPDWLEVDHSFASADSSPLMEN